MCVCVCVCVSVHKNILFSYLHSLINNSGLLSDHHHQTKSLISLSFLIIITDLFDIAS